MTSSTSADLSAERAARRSRAWGIATFLAIAMTLFALLHGYVGSRLFAGLAHPEPAWTVLWLLYLSLPLGPFLERVAPPRLSAPLRLVAYVWMGIFALLLSGAVLTDAVQLGLRLFDAPGADGRWKPLAMALLALPAALYGLTSARLLPRVKRSRFAMPGLGAGLSGLRVVQLSDVHVGEMLLNGRWLERIVARVNALSPDVVVITGDLIDGSVARLREQVASLASLRAPLGVYFITGNHEYYSGGPAWVEEVRRLGITPLMNEHRVLERDGARLVLGGIPDPTGAQFHADHRPDVAAAFAGAPADVPRLLLAHQPRSAPDAARAGVQLQLSGHTHGGQIFPFMFFVRLQQPAVAGWNRIAGVWVYTHRGTGYWGPPMRVGSPAEIAELTLVDGPEARPL